MMHKQKAPMAYQKSSENKEKLTKTSALFLLLSAARNPIVPKERRYIPSAIVKIETPNGPQNSTFLALYMYI